MTVSAGAEVISVLASRRRVCDGGEFLSALFSWPGFAPQERDRAWDRLAGTILYGTAHDIAAAREHLLNGPAS